MHARALLPAAMALLAGILWWSVRTDAPGARAPIVATAVVSPAALPDAPPRTTTRPEIDALPPLPPPPPASSLPGVAIAATPVSTPAPAPPPPPRPTVEATPTTGPAPPVRFVLDQREATDPDPGAAAAMPDRYPASEAQRWFVPAGRRGAGNLGGPPSPDALR